MRAWQAEGRWPPDGDIDQTRGLFEPPGGTAVADRVCEMPACDRKDRFRVMTIRWRGLRLCPEHWTEALRLSQATRRLRAMAKRPHHRHCTVEMASHGEFHSHCRRCNAKLDLEFLLATEPLA